VDSSAASSAPASPSTAPRSTRPDSAREASSWACSPGRPGCGGHRASPGGRGREERPHRLEASEAGAPRIARVQSRAMKLIECVPNFSEGRDRAVLDAITAEISGTEGARLLDVDMGAATHRTVVTFVGTPAAVEEAAFRAIRTAAERIDMSGTTGSTHAWGDGRLSLRPPGRRHHGRLRGHRPPLGSGWDASSESPSICTRRRPPGRSDARSPTSVPESTKVSPASWPIPPGPPTSDPPSSGPGPGHRHRRREFLIAWNVNLNTRDKRLAQRIAEELREKGRRSRTPRDGPP
jgi:glutamate formiminotransferase/formiminotetrahydrofolate cyclodeaminase